MYSYIHIFIHFTFILFHLTSIYILINKSQLLTSSFVFILATKINSSKIIQQIYLHLQIRLDFSQFLNNRFGSLSQFLWRPKTFKEEVARLYTGYPKISIIKLIYIQNDS